MVAGHSQGVPHVPPLAPIKGRFRVPSIVLLRVARCVYVKRWRDPPPQPTRESTSFYAVISKPPPCAGSFTNTRDVCDVDRCAWRSLLRVLEPQQLKAYGVGASEAPVRPSTYDSRWDHISRQTHCVGLACLMAHPMAKTTCFVAQGNRLPYCEPHRLRASSPVSRAT